MKPRNVALMKNIIGITHTSLFSLPGLRGLWFMSNHDESGQIFDSAQGFTLTDDGTVTYGLDEYMGYAEYNGSTQNHFRPDEAGLDITSAVSMFALVYFDTTASAEEFIMTKGGVLTNQRGYQITRDASGNIETMVSSNGTAEFTSTSTTVVGAGVWTYCGMSYNPSTSLKVYTGYLGGTNGQLEVVTNTTSIPASIFANAGKLMFAANQTGASSEDSHLDGRIAVAALANSEWSDNIHNLIWKQLSPLLRIGV